MTDMEHAIEQAAQAVAKRFHETYERLAPAFSYQTREASAKPWEDVPEQNKALMVAVCAELLDAGLLAPATLREEWGVQDVYGETPVAREAYDGSFIRDRDTAEKYGTGFRRPMRRYVSDWEEA